MRRRRRKYTPQEAALPPLAEQTPPALAARSLKVVASALLSPRDWFEEYGEHYGVESPQRVSDLCSVASKTFRRRVDTPSLPQGWACTKFGTRWYLFPVAQPTRDPGGHAPHPKPRPAVTRHLVERAFSALFTVAEWQEHVGEPYYGFTEISYINQMVWERPWGNARQPARLPPGWKPLRLGRSYLIHHETLLPKSLWIK